MRGGHNFVDISGKKYNFLTVIEPSKKEKYGVYWLCTCVCGNRKVVLGQHLKSGKTKSCGCLQKKIASSVNLRHGHALTGKKQTKEYKSWLDMHSRCNNKNNKFYINYGGRGISVCSRWADFRNFISDMGCKPSPKHTLDRIDNSSGYEPSNCRWATRKEQNNNTRATKIIEYNGEKMSLSKWAEKTGIKYNTLRARISRGWDVGRALCN